MESVIHESTVHNPTTQHSTQASSSLYVLKLQVLLLIFLGTGLALAFSLSYSASIQQGRLVGINTTIQQAGMLTLFIKQLVAAVAGLIGIFVIMRISSRVMRENSSMLGLIGIVMMYVTLLIGTEINGARRWLHVMGISIQTGDFVRIALILYLCHLSAQFHTVLVQQRSVNSSANKYIAKLIVCFVAVIGLYGGALYLQRDYSSIIIFCAVIISIAFTSDLGIIWKISGFSILVVLFLVIVVSDTNKMVRVFSYFSSDSDPFGTGFQLQQSYDLIKRGGIFGGGIGSTMLEVLIFPYFNNDFVFSIIISEYGLFGAIIVMGLFWLLCWYAYQLCKRLYYIDKFYYFVTLASTINIAIAAMGHIAVTTGIIPTAGLNLPFYSTGGSSLFSSLLTYGIILKAAHVADSHVYKHSNQNKPLEVNV